jgi:hypothetical protein
MTAERDPSLSNSIEKSVESDADETVKMKRPAVIPPQPTEEEDVNFDPESTLVRDDWESTVIRRVAPHIAAVQSEVAEDPAGEDRFGWESAGLKRLAHEVQKVGV